MRAATTKTGGAESWLGWLAGFEWSPLETMLPLCLGPESAAWTDPDEISADPLLPGAVAAR